jgi:THO complex subunit 3
MAVVETKGENINVTFTRDGATVMVGDKKDKISWIDVKTHKIIGEMGFPSETNEIGYDVEGKLFFATTGKGTVDLYDGDVTEGSFRRKASLPAHAASCYSLSFAPNGKYFAVGSADSLVSIWSRQELLCVQTMNRFKAPARTTGFSHNSEYLASGGEDGLIDICAVSDGSQASQVKVNSAINCVAWNPQSLILAYAAEANKTSTSGCVHLLA